MKICNCKNNYIYSKCNVNARTYELIKIKEMSKTVINKNSQYNNFTNFFFSVTKKKEWVNIREMQLLFTDELQKALSIILLIHNKNPIF